MLGVAVLITSKSDITKEKNCFIQNGKEYPTTQYNAGLYKKHLLGHNVGDKHRRYKMVDIFSNLKKDFNKKFVKTRYVDDLDLGMFWGWIIENFVPLDAVVKPTLAELEQEFINKFAEPTGFDKPPYYYFSTKEKEIFEWIKSKCSL